MSFVQRPYGILPILADPRLIMLTEKSSWWGCGMHVPSVMKPIAKEEWCICEPKVEKEGVQYPPMAPKAD